MNLLNSHMKHIILLFIFTLNIANIAFAQKSVSIIENNGTATCGEIIEENNNIVRVRRFEDGLIRIIYRSSIRSISDTGDLYLSEDSKLQYAIINANEAKKAKDIAKKNAKNAYKELQEYKKSISVK